MIAKLLHRKQYSSSLFYRLLASFAVVILLLVSLNVATYVILRNGIWDEMIKNSSLNLNSTVTSYEKHLTLIRNLLFGILNNDKVDILKNSTDHFNYTVASEVQRDLQTTLGNPLLYVQDVALYFADIDYVIDKDGTREAETMFGKFYSAGRYPGSFWKEEMANPDTFRIYPAVAFTEKTGFYNRPLGIVSPMMVKSLINPHFAIIAYLDSEKLYDSFHQINTTSSFCILNAQGQLLFSVSGDSSRPAWRANDFIGAKGYFTKGSELYFYQKGSETGLTYVNMVPLTWLNRQLLKLNMVMLAVLIVSIVISVSVSVFFAVRFRKPISTIIRSIQQANPSEAPRPSHIKEFDVISEKLHDLFKVNEGIHKDLHVKNSLLQNYAYLSKAKMIHANIQNLKLPIDTNRPFQLILHQLLYKERLVTEMELDPNRASNYFKEFISSEFSGFRDSLTFQIEKDQILTVIFVDDEDSANLANTLEHIRAILSLDESCCDVTIAVSPVYRDTMAFNPAFETVVRMLEQRELGEGVQVISEKKAGLIQAELRLSPADEKEMSARLTEGNDHAAVQLACKVLEQAVKNGASYKQIYELSKEMVNLTIKTMYAMNVQTNHSGDSRFMSEQLKECRTLPRLCEFFRHFMSRSAAAVRQKKNDSDHITGFVTGYVEDHIGGDLSLDLLAEKLNITGAYLSTYFKEKTSTNFSDYVNAVRMKKALELLQGTDLKVQDIAQLVGYYTVASFNRMFKKQTGVSPGEYRRLNAHLPQPTAADISDTPGTSSSSVASAHRSSG